MRFANNVSVSVLRGFVVGAIAGLAFLLVELLARTVFGIPTLPELVQDRLLLLLPGALFAFILERLLYLAKPLFFAGLLLLQLVLLGLGGLIDSRRRRALLLAGGLWLFTGAILAPLSGRGPYAGDPRIALTTLAAFAA